MKIVDIIREEISIFEDRKEDLQNIALDNLKKSNNFYSLREIDKLALLGGSNDPRLKTLSLSKILRENGGTFGRYEIMVRVKPINDQPIDHEFSKEFAGKEGYLNVGTHYSDDDNASYTTVRFNDFVSNSDYKGGGSYVERNIFLDNMYPIDYKGIHNDFVNYDKNVEKDRQAFIDKMKDFGLWDDNLK